MSTRFKVHPRRHHNGKLFRLTLKDRKRKAAHNERTGRTKRLAQRRRLGKLL